MRIVKTLKSKTENSERCLYFYYNDGVLVSNDNIVFVGKAVNTIMLRLKKIQLLG